MGCCFYATQKKIRKVKFLLYIISTMYHREFMEDLVSSIPTLSDHVFVRFAHETTHRRVCAFMCVNF